ncbi:LysR family transcriptional regulator [Acetobacter papayae]|uniref:LysR family transcriptional regulator n=1 Tax=Acetobacter papayae TaxID=1076592 RepID=UPI00046F645A|nr:LysR family transcriptional regulator [Acetobacter papayae]
MIPELRTFLVAGQLENFAATAERVGLTQSAISAQIRRLEQDFGYALFERTGRSVKLSRAGIVAMEQAREIVARYERMRDIARNEAVKGDLEIGVAATGHASLLALAMEEFLKVFSEVHFSVAVDREQALLARLEEGALDMAIMARPAAHLMQTLEWRLLQVQPYVLAVPENTGPLPWRQILQTYPLIRYACRSFAGDKVDAFLKSQNLIVHDIAQTEEISLILDMVAKEAGVAIIPFSTPLSGQENVRFISIPEFVEKKEVGIVTPRKKKNIALKKFLDFLTDFGR